MCIDVHSTTLYFQNADGHTSLVVSHRKRRELLHLPTDILVHPGWGDGLDFLHNQALVLRHQQLDETHLIVEHLLVGDEPIFVPALEADVIPVSGQRPGDCMKVSKAVPKHTDRASLVLRANAEHRGSHLGKPTYGACGST